MRSVTIFLFLFSLILVRINVYKGVRIEMHITINNTDLRLFFIVCLDARTNLDDY
ncbi:hypothetical protein Hanom_Chr10g00935671 [Helianthus anomalus]